jgi:dephospho-CoA kinase
MKTPKIIGLTGGIGSGKSTVAQQFELLGVPIYTADNEAKKVMNYPESLTAIKNSFGTTIFDGTILNRQKLANIVFQDPKKLQQLNKIIHPLVEKDFQLWIKNNSLSPFVIKEAAILFESGSDKDCDKIITVTAPLSTRIQRVMQRDKTDYESVLKRINNQWSDEMRTVKSDFVIHNIDLENTINQTITIFKELTN